MPKVIKKLSLAEKVEQGYLGLKYAAGMNGGYIYEEKRPDLRFPQSVATYQYMSQHPTIAAANNIVDIMIGKVKWKFEVPDNATGKQKSAAEFLNFCMNNMQHTWKSFIEEVGSYRKYGFHIAEKVWREVNQTESKKFSGKLCWYKLATRSQSTISKWKFDDNVRSFLGAYQSTNELSSVSKTDSEIFLPKDKILIFSYKKTRDNPEGHSPLKDCWQSWSYLKQLEAFESVKISKNIGGVLEIGIDAAFLAKAQTDPTSDEATVLATIQTNAENLHSGDSTYLVKPISYTDTGKELFTFRRLGIDGSLGDINTREIINGKQLEILMIYLADVLQLGSTSQGSFALAESKNNLLTFGIEAHLQFIVDVIQEQLVPQTLIVNGFDLKKEQYPTLSYSDLDEVNIDELGKLIQRLASTNMIPKTMPVINEILEKSGFKYRLTDGDIDPESKSESKVPYSELFTTNESGASEGMESGLNSGTGDSLGNNSATNMDNAS